MQDRREKLPAGRQKRRKRGGRVKTRHSEPKEHSCKAVSYAYNAQSQEAERQLTEMLSKSNLPDVAEDNMAAITPALVGLVASYREQREGVRGVTVARAFTLIGKRVTTTLFDSGASPSILRYDVWQEVSRQNPDIAWRSMDEAMQLSMPNGTKLLTMGQVTLPVTILGRIYSLEVFVTKLLPAELIIGLPAMCQMGAVLNTANLSITFRADPHRSLDILIEGGASQEAYTVLEDTQLPARSESLVKVTRKAMGLSPQMSSEEWREVTPNYSTERFKELLIAPGLSEGPVTNLLVANLVTVPRKLHKGTRLAIGKAMTRPGLPEVSCESALTG